MKFCEGILDLLFPPKCPFCGRVVERLGICAGCQKNLPWTTEQEALRPGGLRCAAPLWYEGLTRDGILRLKFGHVAAAAEPMGERMAQCAAEQFGGEFDTVTWVPVSRKRLKQRGYDQAELLARAACRLWDTVPQRLLEKPLDNPAQSSIRDAAARRANVLGMYEPASGGAIAGRQILLVDDVCTTGATMTECVRVLREAGADSVVCVAVAFTREKKEKQG